MNIFAQIDWSIVALAAFALAFAWLILKAAQKMRAKSLSDEPTQEKDEKAKLKDKPDAKTDTKPVKKKQVKDKSDAKDTAKEIPSSKRDEKELAEEEKEKLTQGLAKTRGGFIAKLGKLFTSTSTFDESMLEQVEEVLFTADIGTRTADELITGIRKQFGKKAGNDPDAIWDFLKSYSAALLEKNSSNSKKTYSFAFDKHKPFVLLMVGVNGTGKTTTIGKLAAQFKSQGLKVLLAAGDTYRAAAAEQLTVWAERTESDIVRRDEGADPSSVIVEAIKKAKHDNVDVVICDTAGRLHTQQSLMDELKKIPRSIAKHLDGAPHETFLVLDATTGQNAINQAKLFKEVVDISGIVLTKLDGTAKGGVVLGIAHELAIPVRFIGIGEQIKDLRPFDANAFVEALFKHD